jgi:N-acyl-L-homoserine lactone synthetase
MSWRGRTIEARCLTPAEVADWYLPLRYDVLSRELRWTVGNVRSPADMRDAYDRHSVAFGVVAGAHLIGTSRLVLSRGADDLPSVKRLLSLGRAPRIAFPAAEISRVMVRRECRKLGMFPVLLLSTLLLALRAQVRTLIITEHDDARFARTMAIYGFKRLVDGFSFVDDMIAPDEPAVTYALDMESIDRDSRQVFAAQMEILLRTADELFASRNAGSDHGGEQQRLPGVVIMGRVRDVPETRIEHQLAGLSGGEPMQG